MILGKENKGGNLHLIILLIQMISVLVGKQTLGYVRVHVHVRMYVCVCARAKSLTAVFQV